MSKLAGKVAIITGAAQGIGRGIAELFAKEGAISIIWDVQKDKALDTVASIKNMGYKADFIEGVNITQLDSVERAAKEVMDKYGKIDILVNNAGIVRDASFKKMTSEQWDSVIDVNLTGVFNCAKAVSNYMTEANYGRIVNIASIVGITGNFGQTNYVAAKAGVIGMTKVWGKELGKHNITVNAIAPGPIETDMFATIPEEMRKGMIQQVPVRRLGKPADIANAALFFASDETSFVTGHTMVVDGGATLGG
ncbi:MAG: 3-oxoacyl-ACP reductase FabG [Cytophagales bacterium]|nr:MAG: 3-oxoacyl-ACP reductase FabG [Cytophagales bacterium]